MGLAWCFALNARREHGNDYPLIRKEGRPLGGPSDSAFAPSVLEWCIRETGLPPQLNRPFRALQRFAARGLGTPGIKVGCLVFSRPESIRTSLTQH